LEINQDQTVTISAQVPANTVLIYGYTSPNSRVELNSSRAFAVTYSQENGYFVFDHIILPRHSQDLCLTSQDESNRLNNPVCIPEPPLYNSYTEIGPILLSPTLSLDLQNQYSSGQSIPNSTIQVYLYQQSSPLSLIKKVQAFDLPILETKTDSQGNYSLNLPNTTAANYRIFSTVQYLEANSPKSNTLLYHPNYFISLLYLLIPLLIIILSLFFIFKKTRRRFLPAVIYNKLVATYEP
jgi:hypothetical protein